MNHRNNPAGRMFLLLQEMKDKNAPWGRVLADHLGFKTNEHLVLKAVGPFLALPAAIRKQILELDVNHNMYLRHLKEIEDRLMSTPPGQSAKSLVEGFSAAAIQSLEFCSEALSRLRAERLFEDDELSKLHKEIATLADEISTSDIGPDLKAFMIDKLSLLLDAIRLYAVSGAEPLTRAVESLVGSCRINPSDWERVNTTKFAKRFWQFLQKALLVVALVDGTQSIGAKVAKLLPSGTKEVATECTSLNNGRPAENEADEAPDTETDSG